TIYYIIVNFVLVSNVFECQKYDGTDQLQDIFMTLLCSLRRMDESIYSVLPLFLLQPTELMHQLFSRLSILP
ncbi:hypothetical protein L9F63_019269, partial [Diploptera punctata]